MAIASLGKGLMVLGVVLLVVGALMWAGGRVGLGALPGDISVRRGNTSLYVPIVSSIIISIVLTVVLNILARLGR